MKISFTELSWQDYIWFQKNDRKLLKRINLLIKDITRTPFEGIGKPEPLKANLSGYWSRRINSEHRLIYEITQDELKIIACRFH
jgi:toxin YoeB